MVASMTPHDKQLIFACFRPIAFHPASILFETPNHAELLEKTGARSMIMGVIDELLFLASAQGCSFPQDFREHTMETMIQPTSAPSTMYQDYAARRPLEIETFLGSPIKLAQDAGVQVPRIETIYALLHNANVINQTRPQQSFPSSPAPPSNARMPPGPRGPMNGPMPGPMGRGSGRPGSRAPSMGGAPPPPPMRRGPSVNGYPPRMMNGSGPRGPPAQQRRPSIDGDLEEFSHLMLYEGMPEGHLPEQVAATAYNEGAPNHNGSGELSLREREFQLRQRELALRDQEFGMRRRMPPPPASHAGGYDEDDDDGEDFFDPMVAGKNVPMIDPDNFDMMSVTSRRTRKAPSASQLRQNPEAGGPHGKQGRGPFGRPRVQQRISTRLMADVPGLHDSIMDNPLMGYSSDRYGNVDRQALGHESRTNSLTAERLHDLQRGPGGPMPPMPRRASQSPGNPLGPGNGHPYGPPGRPMQGRPSPPNGYGPNGPHNGYGQNGPSANGRPSPPGAMRAPLPRHPPGHGNAVAPQQVEQQVGVSTLYPPKGDTQVRSLTGSASASAGSGDSNRSAPIDSEPSAHSSSSSLGPRPPIAV